MPPRHQQARLQDGGVLEVRGLRLLLFPELQVRSRSMGDVLGHQRAQLV